jgi:hypothetical protein
MCPESLFSYLYYNLQAGPERRTFNWYGRGAVAPPGMGQLRIRAVEVGRYNNFAIVDDKLA